MNPFGPIPPDYDRDGSDGELFDPILGYHLRDLDESVSWSRGPEGTVIRDSDPASPYNPLSPSRGTRRERRRDTLTTEQILLLLLS